MKKSYKEKSKLISIIIPTYNTAKYINEAIQSILNQSYQCFEILVVDDGSTDNTREIVKSYGDIIEYIYQNNQGLAAARNTGISNVKGKYFTFLDADDHWEPDNLKIKMKILEKDQTIDAVFSDFILFDDSKIIKKGAIKSQYPIFYKRKRTFDDIFQHKEKINLQEGKEIEVYKGNVLHSLLFGNFINACSIVIKKESQGRTGLFRPELRNQEDYEYWLRFSKIHKMAYVDVPLVSYRRHPDQLTAHQNSEIIFRTIAEILKPYYRDKKHIFPKELIKPFRRRYSKVYEGLGSTYLGKGENKKAKDAFKLGLSIDKGNIIIFLYWLFSFLPSKITNDFTTYLLNKIKIRKDS